MHASIEQLGGDLRLLNPAEHHQNHPLGPRGLWRRRPLLAVDQLALVHQLQLRELLRDRRLAQQMLLGGFREASQICQIAEYSKHIDMHYKPA